MMDATMLSEAGSHQHGSLKSSYANNYAIGMVNYWSGSKTTKQEQDSCGKMKLVSERKWADGMGEMALVLTRKKIQN